MVKIGRTDNHNFIKHVLDRLCNNELLAKNLWSGFWSNLKLDNLLLIYIMKDISVIIKLYVFLLKTRQK